MCCIYGVNKLTEKRVLEQKELARGFVSNNLVISERRRRTDINGVQNEKILYCHVTDITNKENRAFWKFLTRYSITCSCDI